MQGTLVITSLFYMTSIAKSRLIQDLSYPY